MLLRNVEQHVRRYSEKVADHVFGKINVTADLFTFTGLFLTIGVIGLLVNGFVLWSGLLLLVASSFDIIDGAVARSKGMTRPFGAFLDSTLDRYSEAMVFIGLILYYYIHVGRFDVLYPLLIIIASQGSLLTSYIKARAESLGFQCRGGIIERPERVILLAIGMITGWLTASLIALAVLTHVSALQRFLLVWKQNKA